MSDKYFGSQEGPAIPHLARAQGEVFDLRNDLKRAFTRVETDMGAAAKLPFDNVVTVAQTNPNADHDTLQEAIDAVASMPGGQGIVLVSSGDYTSEGIIEIEGVTLTKLTIKAVAHPYVSHTFPYAGLVDGTVRVAGFRSLNNNQNLRYLAFEGIEDTSGDFCNIRASVDGASNLLGADGIYFRGCSLDNNLVSGAAYIFADGCNFKSNPQPENYTQAVFQSCYIGADIDAQCDGFASNYPAGFVDSDLQLRDCRVIGQVAIWKNTTEGVSPFFTINSVRSEVGNYYSSSDDTTITIGIGSTTAGVDMGGANTYDLVLDGGRVTDTTSYPKTISQADSTTYGANERVGALPTASAVHSGKVWYVPGDGATTQSTAHICMLAQSGAYEWIQLAVTTLV